jgi:hypothetical protein
MNTDRRGLYNKPFVPLPGQYYNGWQHDLQEPDWGALAAVIPRNCQISRDINGNYYHNGGYTDSKWIRRDINLNQTGTLSLASKSNRSQCYVITNYENTGSDVMVCPGYWSTIYFIDLATWTSLNRSPFSAGYFTDIDGDTNPIAVNPIHFGSLGFGSGIYDFKGNTILLVAPCIITDGTLQSELKGKFIDKYVNGAIRNTTVTNDRYVMTADNKYVCFQFKYKIVVCYLKAFIESGYDIDKSYVRTIAQDYSRDQGYNAFYIYKNFLVTMNFYSEIKVFDLNDGYNVISMTAGSSDTGAMFWRNKILNTGTKNVTVLDI